MTSAPQQLLSWYDQHRRTLPWRGSTSGYAVMVSEAMLQQTQVQTVIPYYQRFLQRFPTLESLALASPQEVLRLWSGLGYYRRARHLHLAAQRIVEQFLGVFPNRAAELRTLPGIGPYTANAIASIAFQEPVAVVDGNVKRVFSRLMAFRQPIDTPLAAATFQQLADDWLVRQRPGDFNQAVMELGALICRPRHPLCDRCPLANVCEAKRLGLQEALPRKPTPLPTRHFYGFGFLVLAADHKLLLTDSPPRPLQRPGMWEIPVFWQPLLAAAVQQIESTFKLRLQDLHELKPLKHAITVNRLTVRPVIARLKHRAHSPGSWHSLNHPLQFPVSGLCKKAMALL